MFSPAEKLTICDQGKLVRLGWSMTSMGICSGIVVILMLSDVKKGRSPFAKMMCAVIGWQTARSSSCIRAPDALIAVAAISTDIRLAAWLHDSSIISDTGEVDLESQFFIISTTTSISDSFHITRREDQNFGVDNAIVRHLPQI